MIDNKYDPCKLFLKVYKYDTLYKEDEEKSTLQPEKTIPERVKLRKQKVDDEDLSNLPTLEGNEEEVKEGKGLKIIVQNKLLTRIPILLAQIKAGNNSSKLKNEMRQIPYLLYQQNKTTKRITTI